MFENIGSFFKKIMKNETKELVSDTIAVNNTSKEAAKERLQLVLMQDRANVSADFLELMKQEIVDVIKKYIVVEEDTIDVRIINQENEDGTQGAPSLCANIPILNIRNDNKGEKFRKEQNASITKEVINQEQNDMVNDNNSNDNVEIVNENNEKLDENLIKEFNNEIESNEISNEENVESDDLEEVEEKIEETNSNQLEETVEESGSDDSKSECSNIEKFDDEKAEELDEEELKRLEKIANAALMNTSIVVNSEEYDEDDDDDVTFDDLLKAAEEEEKMQKQAKKAKSTKTEKATSTKSKTTKSTKKTTTPKKKTNKK